LCSRDSQSAIASIVRGAIAVSSAIAALRAAVSGPATMRPRIATAFASSGPGVRGGAGVDGGAAGLAAASAGLAGLSLGLGAFLRAARGAAATLVAATSRTISAPRIEQGLTNRDALRNMRDPTSYRRPRFPAGETPAAAPTVLVACRHDCQVPEMPRCTSD